jgi:hypothetical protein
MQYSFESVRMKSCPPAAAMVARQFLPPICTRCSTWNASPADATMTSPFMSMQ